MLCVVCGHVLVYDIYGFSAVWKHSPLLQFICTFHMPLFIFLSGLVASPPNSIKDVPKDIWKRFRILIMPMLVIGSIYSLATKHDLSFAMNEMKYGYWYFLVLFYCYILNHLSINNLNTHRGGGNIYHSDLPASNNMENRSTPGQIHAGINTEYFEHQSAYSIFPIFPDGLFNKKALFT